MKNKVLLFSKNGVMFKEVSSDELSCGSGKVLTLGEKGQIDCSSYVVFIKNTQLENFDKSKFDHLEIYIFNTLVFKGYGFYNNGGGHSMPSIIAEFDNEMFRIGIEGGLYKEVSVLKNCQ